MRVVRELVKEGIRVSIFSWNSKYILKFELGPMEQTFKLGETDILEETELNGFLEGEFFEKVQARFKEMGDSLLGKLENT
ncbi:MAG: hypothetical protein ACK5B5_00015 [Bacteroidota bacterium]|jgi:hypothetical protein|nr:hypothetical protein [Algoriphagus sp.]